MTATKSVVPSAVGKRQCKAKSKRTGNRCRSWAMRGTTVCRHHGGKAPQVQAAVQRRAAVQKVEADARAELASQGVNVAGLDPLETLARVAAEIEAMKDALGKRVNALTEIRYQAGTGEQLRAEILLYERALDRTMKSAEILARLDLEGRRVSAQERWRDEIIGLIQQVLEDLSLSSAQWALFPVVMGRRLNAGLSARPARQVVVDHMTDDEDDEEDGS